MVTGDSPDRRNAAHMRKGQPVPRHQRWECHRPGGKDSGMCQGVSEKRNLRANKTQFFSRTVHIPFFVHQQRALSSQSGMLTIGMALVKCAAWEPTSCAFSVYLM